MELSDQSPSTSFVSCKICDKGFHDRSDLIQHLQMEHEILELASYVAATMADEQDRDRTSREFRRRFDLLKRELAGHEKQR